MITILSGGRGTPKLIEGLRNIIRDDEITVIVNTADDFVWNGLYISPDIDTVIYLFADILDTNKYWGIKEDTYNFLEQAKKYGIKWPWFNIGDKDLAMHIIRTHMINNGFKLHEVVKYMLNKLNITANIIPMSNDRIETYLLTNYGKMHIQEFLVLHRSKPEVYKIWFEGLDRAMPAPGVIESILSSKLIIIGPSNPINSIGPIIGIKNIREALKSSNAIKVAISPLINGKPVSGPADKFMKASGYEPTLIGLTKIYHDIIDILFIDYKDKNYIQYLSSEYNIKVIATNILMNTAHDKIRLAREIIQFISKEIIN